MQAGTLTFAWTPWSVAMAIIALLVTATLGVTACRRSRWNKSTVILETIRFLMVTMVAILLGGPEWTTQYRPNSKPVVAVLWDDSASMQTRDVSTTSSGKTNDVMTRQEAIHQLTQDDTWQSLNQRAKVVISSFSSEVSSTNSNDGTEPANQINAQRIANRLSTETESGTNLTRPLGEAIDKYENLLGVVVVSDGDWNTGGTPIQAATRLRLADVPIFSFPIGSESRLPDLDVINFDVPSFAIAGKRVRIPVTIESSLPRDHVATILMKTSAGEEITKEIRIAAMGRTAESIDWEPSELGDESLTLTLSHHASEIRTDNNQRTAPIAIREEKLRVLVIESFPRWEYRYLRNALSRDPGVDVSCLLFHPSLDKRGGGNLDYIADFPATKEELAKYDVVFLGDVGIDDDQLTLEQCEWLRGLVGQQASGLVFLPGWEGRTFSLLETELSDLIPVVLDESQPDGWGSRTPQHFELTELGRRSLLTKLADTADDNLQVWQNLPGFQWYAPVLKAKPGTDTLCVHQEISNQYGRIPLLVTRTFGAGKVLFMGTDGAWRWRKGVEDLYHYRFWGQVVRWMAYRRNIANGENMRLYYTPERPKIRQTMTISANVMESSGEPLQQGNVTLRVTTPTGRIESLRLSSDGGQWGAFSGSYSPSVPGEHVLTLFCKETGDSVTSKIYVQGNALEQIGKPARPEVLQEIARMTRGQVLAIDQVDEVKKWLAALPDPPPAVRRTPLWSHPAMVVIMVTLLTLFWIGRKGVGLI